MARTLAPGGRFLLVAPFEWEEHQQPHDYFRFTRYSLDYLLRPSRLRPTSRSSPSAVFFRLLSRRLFNALQFFPGPLMFRRRDLLRRPRRCCCRCSNHWTAVKTLHWDIYVPRANLPDSLKPRRDSFPPPDFSGASAFKYTRQRSPSARAPPAPTPIANCRLTSSRSSSLQVRGHRRPLHRQDTQGRHPDEEHHREVPRQERKGRRRYRTLRHQAVSRAGSSWAPTTADPPPACCSNWRAYLTGQPRTDDVYLVWLRRRRGRAHRMGRDGQSLRQPPPCAAMVQGRHRRADQGTDQRRHDRRQRPEHQAGAELDCQTPSTSVEHRVGARL